MDGSANDQSAVDNDIEAKRGRNGSAQPGERGFHTVRCFNHVRAGLAKNGDDDARIAVGEAEVANIFDGIGNRGDVDQASGGARMPSNNERFVFVRLEKLIGIRDRPGALVV